MMVRPRRSVLFMPGSNLRAMEKARSLKVDSLILDLEDAVSADKKELARAQVVTAVQENGFGRRELIIRANGLDTQWCSDDITAIANSGADGICIPKIESAEQVREVIDRLDAAGAPSSLQLWVMVETPRAIQAVDEIAAAHSRMSVIVVGTADLAKELRVVHTPDRIGLQYALSRCVNAARCNAKVVLDGVYLDVKDLDGLEAVCIQGRNMGFDGKTLIHPSQLSTANDIFGLSDADVSYARRVIALWEETQRSGKAVVLLDGQLIEEMHVEEARERIVMAELMAELDDSASAQ